MAVLLCLTHGMKLSQMERDFIFEPLLFSKPQLSHPSQAPSHYLILVAAMG